MNHDAVCFDFRTVLFLFFHNVQFEHYKTQLTLFTWLACGSCGPHHPTLITISSACAEFQFHHNLIVGTLLPDWLTDWQQTYWQTVGRTNLRSRVNFRRPFQCWYVAGFCWTHLPLVGTQDDGEKKVFALQHRTTTVSGGVVVIVLICLDKLMQSPVRWGIVRSAKDNNNCGKKRVNYARPANKVCLNLLPWRWRARGVC